MWMLTASLWSGINSAWRLVNSSLHILTNSRDSTSYAMLALNGKCERWNHVFLELLGSINCSSDVGNCNFKVTSILECTSTVVLCVTVSSDLPRVYMGPMRTPNNLQVKAYHILHHSGLHKTSIRNSYSHHIKIKAEQRLQRFNRSCINYS